MMRTPLWLKHFVTGVTIHLYDHTDMSLQMVSNARLRMSDALLLSSSTCMYYMALCKPQQMQYAFSRVPHVSTKALSLSTQNILLQTTATFCPATHACVVVWLKPPTKIFVLLQHPTSCTAAL
jgi:hypothetical protein